MNREIIGAFSSDSRELYKADIYRTLCLPEGEIVHFRYKTKYVDSSLLRHPNDLIGKDVAIFSSQGNSLNTPHTANELTNISVRMATICACHRSDETDVFHVYLKLTEFINATINTETLECSLPPSKFLSIINITIKSFDNNWKSRVEAVKKIFPEMSFFFIKGIFNIKNNRVNATYSGDGKSSIYSLSHGERYTLKLSLGNPDGAKTKLSLTDNSNDISINSENPIESSVQYDDIDIPVNVKTIPVLKQSTFLSFRLKSEDGIEKNKNKRWTLNNKKKSYGEYTTNIELSLELNFCKAAIFGFFSTLAFIALIVSKGDNISSNIPAVILSCALIFISAGGLFYFFNKK